MPIPVTKIKDALRPLQERIYEFLAADPENAFGAEEIYLAVTGRNSRDATAEMSDSQRNDHFTEFFNAFKELMADGRIEHAKHNDKNYWFAKAGDR